jgi:hypothetical protein
MMTTRITDKIIKAKLAYLNELTGNPIEPYAKDENGQYKAQIGCYHLSGAYGGVCIHQMHTEGGGVNTVHGLPGYYAPKRQTYDTLCAYIAGIEAAKQ